MGRGFLAGIFWGGLIGLSLLVLSNQMMDRRELSFLQPDAAPVEVPAGTEFDQARPESEPVVPQVEERPAGEVIAGVQAPEELVETPPSFDTSALEVPTPAIQSPETLGEAPEPAEDPEIVMTGPDVSSVVEDSPALPSPEAPTQAPVTASGAPEPAIVPEPVDEPAPVTVPETDDTPEAAVEARPEEDDTGSVDLGTVEEERAPLIIIHDDDDAADTSEGDNALISIDPAPAPAETPEAAPQPDVADAPSGIIVPGSDGADFAFLRPDVDAVEAPEPQGEAPSIDTDTAILPVEPAPDVDTSGNATNEDIAIIDTPRTLPTVRRLPGQSDDEEAAPDVAEAPEPVENAPEPTGRALTDWRVAFDDPRGQPLVAMVLIHEAGTSVSDVIRATPNAVAIGVQAGIPDAAEVAAAYRDAGREVVMVPSLPSNATPQDVETALQANFVTIPQAVAVMDSSGEAVQPDRDAVAQIVDVIATTGHGLITFPRGLNTALQQAERSGVPAGLVFRDLDGAGENAEEVQRALDRAAFRARQDAAVILVGRTSGETLVALTEWVLGSRAQTVTIAPVSVALDGVN